MGLKIFIGGSKEMVKEMQKVAVWVENEGHTPQKWSDSNLFISGDFVLEELIKISKDVDGAILIFSEDDSTLYRDLNVLQPRDNVLIEFGLFTGALGRHKAIICRKGTPKMASDLGGLIYTNLDTPANAEAKIGEWLSKISIEKKKTEELEKVIIKVDIGKEQLKTGIKQRMFRQYLGTGKSNWFEQVVKELPQTTNANFVWIGGYLPFILFETSDHPEPGDFFSICYTGEETFLTGQIHSWGHKTVDEIVELNNYRAEERINSGFSNLEELSMFVSKKPNSNNLSVGYVTLVNLKIYSKYDYENKFRYLTKQKSVGKGNTLFYTFEY